MNNCRIFLLILVVFALMGLGACNNAAEKATRNTQPPITPGELKARATDQEVELQWASARFAENYTVYWSHDKTAELSTWESASKVSSPHKITLEGLYPVVYFRVVASNRYGTSAPSTQLTLVLPPRQLTATAGNTQVGLRWTWNDGVSYILYWSNQSGINKSDAAVIRDINALPYIHKNLTNDKSYYYFVTATYDGIESDPSNIVEAVPGNNVNHTPVITAPQNSMIQIDENTRIVTQVSATDEDRNEITYSISDGADQGFFEIDPASGLLQFKQVPDYEQPQDANKNNTYQVTVRASDSLLHAERILDITVNNVTKPTIPVWKVEAGFKTLNFSWENVPAQSFQVFFNPDGVSGYTSVSNPLPTGTTRYDLEIAVHRLNWTKASYLLEVCHEGSCERSTPLSIMDLMLKSIGYIKASNPSTDNSFGLSIALSADGKTLAVGAPGEGSAGSGVNATDTCQGATPVCANGSGAVYVYQRNPVQINTTNGGWGNPVYIKAPAPSAGDSFGWSLSLSADGNILAVGAPHEDGAGRDMNPPDTCPGAITIDCASDSGAVFIYRRNPAQIKLPNGGWNNLAYIKATIPTADDLFGERLALSANGNTLAIGYSPFGRSRIKTVYTFNLSAIGEKPAYIDSPEPEFGSNLTLSANGGTLVVGSSWSNTVYVYERDFSMINGWSTPISIKTPSAPANDEFGSSLALSADANTLAVGALHEDSAGQGVNATDTCPGAITTACAENSGAVYVYRRDPAQINTANGGWGNPVYIKAHNPSAYDYFGSHLTLSTDGNTLAVGAPGEDGAGSGVDAADKCQGTAPVCADGSGAVYVYQRDPAQISTANGGWGNPVYIKTPNPSTGDSIGRRLSLSADGNTLAVGTQAVYLY